MSFGWNSLTESSMVTDEDISGPGEVTKPEALAIEDKLQAILEEWQGTPYMEFQQVKGMGVDCARFVLAVIDELYGTVRTPTDSSLLPPDGATHSPSSAFSVFHTILDLYSPYYYVKNGVFEPGDIIINGPILGGPAHALIAGKYQNQFWQSTKAGVHYTGLPYGQPGWEVKHVIRLDQRDIWLRSTGI